MVVTWLTSLAKDMAQRFRKDWSKAPQTLAADTFQPEAEQLEDRNSVSAIRNLAGLTTNSLPHEDDAPSLQANIGFNINFFGVSSNTLFVNNNGNVTISQALAQFTPQGLTGPLPGIGAIIAPFFADVDTTNAASNVVTFGTSTLCGHRVFGVDWVNVGYFASHVDKLNSFQLLLIDRSDTGAGNFDIEFNYNQIRWETGDASGGVNGLGGSSAVVGYSNGSGTPGTNFEIPGSAVNGAFLDGGVNALISNSLLASTPGRYHFLIRNGQVSDFQEVTSSVRVFNPFRFVYNPATGTYFCNLTIFNQGGGSNCLDEVPNGGIPSITLAFTGLPPGVGVVNQTGVTASGVPFISIPNSNIPLGQVIRVPIQLSNPNNANLGTFNMPPGTKVFSGAFDPNVVV